MRVYEKGSLENRNGTDMRHSRVIQEPNGRQILKVSTFGPKALHQGWQRGNVLLLKYVMVDKIYGCLKIDQQKGDLEIIHEELDWEPPPGIIGRLELKQAESEDEEEGDSDDSNPKKR